MNRQAHFDFIKKDTAARGEEMVSHISFFAAIYSVKVKTKDRLRAKTVTYTAAESNSNGYRQIEEGDDDE